jgi:hypothetical protein
VTRLPVPPPSPSPGSASESTSDSAPRSDLGALTDLVRRLERDGLVRPRAGDDGRAPAAVATGWAGLDGRIGTCEGAPGLARGALHEWVGLADPSIPIPGSPDHSGPIRRGPIHGVTGSRRNAQAGAPPSTQWSPPLTLLAHLAGRALDERLARGGGRERSGSVLWIGRAVWPYAATLLGADELREHVVPGAERTAAKATCEHTLQLELELDERPCAGSAAERPLFARSLFVAPTDAAGRLWAVDAALRCPTVTAVVVDASGFDMAATRRLALAANTGEALALLARPPHEERALSAAATRWRVTRAGDSLAPCWRLELLRAKPPQRRTQPS